MTHQDLSSLHRDVGGLQRGQMSLEANYGALRAEMHTGFDRLAKLIQDSRDAAEEPSRNGVTLSFSQLVMIAAALFVAGIFLAPVLGRLPMVGS